MKNKRTSSKMSSKKIAKKLKSMFLESSPYSVPEIRQSQKKIRDAYIKRYDKDLARDVSIVREEITRGSEERKLNETLNKILIPAEENIPQSDVNLTNIIRKIAKEVAQEVVKQSIPTTTAPKLASKEEQGVQQALYKIHCILANFNSPTQKLIEIIRETNKTKDLFHKTPPFSEIPLSEQIKLESDQIKDEEDIKKIIDFADKNGISSVLHNLYPNEITGEEMKIESIPEGIKYFKSRKKTSRKALIKKKSSKKR